MSHLSSRAVTYLEPELLFSSSVEAISDSNTKLNLSNLFSGQSKFHEIRVSEINIDGQKILFSNSTDNLLNVDASMKIHSPALVESSDARFIPVNQQTYSMYSVSLALALKQAVPKDYKGVALEIHPGEGFVTSLFLNNSPNARLVAIEPDARFKPYLSMNLKSNSINLSQVSLQNLELSEALDNLLNKNSVLGKAFKQVDTLFSNCRHNDFQSDLRLLELASNSPNIQRLVLGGYYKSELNNEPDYYLDVLLRALFMKQFTHVQFVSCSKNFEYTSLETRSPLTLILTK
ncbi:MAG: hypothetical protein SFU25_08560 [Candidatus Caenarcaniphilales bacterium]|nr:hypothetical protein [Candidatus Caenarcaniphilales bacterium]